MIQVSLSVTVPGTLKMSPPSPALLSATVADVGCREDLVDEHLVAPTAGVVRGDGDVVLAGKLGADLPDLLRHHADRHGMDEG
ncbi:hypothetical protein [Streptomyces diastatochromogenes]|uniref:hypothetical protein n=1 Tax=Streptomyces diastatochromogenes TaxID=42236 RepID=UPI0011806024|nr:hypothetical protein [Streptomyces diastatochromogenes]